MAWEKRRISSVGCCNERAAALETGLDTLRPENGHGLIRGMRLAGRGRGQERERTAFACAAASEEATALAIGGLEFLLGDEGLHKPCPQPPLFKPRTATAHGSETGVADARAYDGTYHLRPARQTAGWVDRLNGTPDSRSTCPPRWKDSCSEEPWHGQGEVPNKPDGHRAVATAPDWARIPPVGRRMRAC